LLEQNLRVLTLECLPRDLPDRITVDISQLNIGDSIHVRDIQLPLGSEQKVPADLTAFSVLAQWLKKPPLSLRPKLLPEPEVITEKKGEGEAAAPAPAAKEKGSQRKRAEEVIHFRFFDFGFRDVEEKPIRLVAGLGNPGRNTRPTRHNIGFMVVDQFAAQFGSTWERSTKWTRCRQMRQCDDRKPKSLYESERAIHFWPSRSFTNRAARNSRRAR